MHQENAEGLANSIETNQTAPEGHLMIKPVYSIWKQQRHRSASATAQYYNKWAASWQNQQNGMCIQWRLGIHPVWAGFSLSAWRNLGSLATHCKHSEDSEETGWMPKLIWVFAGHTVILLVLLWGVSNNHLCCKLQKIVFKYNYYCNDPKFSERYAWANSADLDQTAPRGAIWPGSTLFAIPSASFGLITLW